LDAGKLNVALSAIIVAVGVLAIFLTPTVPLLVLGAVAFLLSFDRKAAAKFMMMGGLSTGFGALGALGLPSSLMASLKMDGSPFAATLLTPDPYLILSAIGAIGILSLGLKIDLTPVQRDTLTAMINIHRQESRAVKGKEIGELMDRNPETVRIHLRSLKALNLVESVTGPNGGYMATPIAYDALSIDKSSSDDEVNVPVVRNGIFVEGASVNEIVFNNVMQSTLYSFVSIRIIGNIKAFAVGDDIEIGPTPVNHLYIRGRIVALDRTASRMVLDIAEMISIPRHPVKAVAQRAIRISPGTSLREASMIMVVNGVQEALVGGESPGLVSLADITRAVAEGRTGLLVRDIMTPGYLTISSDAPLFEAAMMLGRTGAKQLVVQDNGMPWGFITPRNLMGFLAPASIFS
jgi:predicted transcriptional regulator